MDFILGLIDSLAWPLTVLIIIFGFRKNFSNSINRLNNINAGAGGVSFSFSDKIAAAKNQIEQLRTGVVSKSGSELRSSSNLSPLKNKLEKKVTDIASKEGVAIQSVGLLSQANELKEKGIISIEQAKEIEIINDLINSADSTVSDSESQEIKQLIDKVGK